MRRPKGAHRQPAPNDMRPEAWPEWLTPFDGKEKKDATGAAGPKQGTHRLGRPVLSEDAIAEMRADVEQFKVKATQLARLADVPVSTMRSWLKDLPKADAYRARKIVDAMRAFFEDMHAYDPGYRGDKPRLTYEYSNMTITTGEPVPPLRKEVAEFMAYAVAQLGTGGEAEVMARVWGLVLEHAWRDGVRPDMVTQAMYKRALNERMSEDEENAFWENANMTDYYSSMESADHWYR